MSHYQNSLDNIIMADGASNHVSEYEFIQAAKKHLDKRLDEIKKLVKAGQASVDETRNKELRAITAQRSTYAIDAIKEHYGEDNLAFALSFGTQTSVRVCNIELQEVAA